MPSKTDIVTAVCDGYRAALLRGDQDFADDVENTKILQAVIAASLAETADWVQSRWGEELAAPLDKLFERVNKTDTLGHAWTTARHKAAEKGIAVARGMLWALVGNGAFPLCLTAVVSVALGSVGLVYQGGSALGVAALTGLAGGGSAVWALVRTLAAAPTAFQAVSGGASSLYDAAGAFGSKAERVFAETVSPPLEAMYRTAAVPYRRRTVLDGMRSAAQVIIGVLYALLVAGLIVLAAGVYHGCTQWQEHQPCPYGQTRIHTVCQEPLPFQ